MYTGIKCLYWDIENTALLYYKILTWNNLLSLKCGDILLGQLDLYNFVLDSQL